MTYSCKCPCGTTQYEIQGEPIIRFYCHCTICQRMYDSPSVDITVYKLNDVVLPEDHNISFAQYKRFAAVDRGNCPECKKPILSKVGEGEKGFAFVATRNYVNTEGLLDPEMHVYYGTRTKDAEDDLPKYSNGLTSRWAFIKSMIGSSK